MEYTKTIVSEIQQLNFNQCQSNIGFKVNNAVYVSGVVYIEIDHHLKQVVVNVRIQDSNQYLRVHSKTIDDLKSIQKVVFGSYLIEK